jgi:30S ribosomal protein S31
MAQQSSVVWHFKMQISGLFVTYSDILIIIPERYWRSKKINMGRGDKKTKKGKIFKGSFGKSRPAKPAKKSAPAAKPAAAAPAAPAAPAAAAKGK